MQQLIRRAQRDGRVIAIRLLDAAQSDAGDRGAVAMLHGYRLYRTRRVIDHSLDKAVELARAVDDPDAAVDTREAAALRRVTDSLREFTDRAAAAPDSFATLSIAELDAALSAIFTPLADAVAILDGRLPESHWIDQREIEAAGPASGEDLTWRDAATRLETLPAPARGVYQDAFAALTGVGRHHPARLAFLARLDDALVVAAYDWPDPDLGDAVAAHAGNALTDEAAGRSLALIARFLRAASASSPGPAAWPPSTLDAVLVALLDAGTDDASRRLLAEIAERADRRRRITPAALPRDLVSLRKRLGRLYDRAEREVIELAPALATGDASLADPPVAAVVEYHRDLTDSLERIERLPQCRDVMRLVNPRASGRVDNQIRKIARWLLDRQRHADGALALAQLDQQCRLFYPLPVEQRLAANDVQLAALTGGRGVALWRTIVNRREAWAEAWGRGDASGPDARRMALLYQLTAALDALSDLADVQDGALSLNDWAAWEFRNDALEDAVQAMVARVNLAAEAAIEGEDDRLADFLDEIEDSAAVTVLAGVLLQKIAPALAARPINAAAAVGQFAYPPHATAWGRDHRLPIARACRSALEAAHARRLGRNGYASEHAAYVSRQAEQVLASFGRRRLEMPTLVGFDGSDPAGDAAPDAGRRGPARRR